MLDEQLQDHILKALKPLYPGGTYDLPAAISALTGDAPPDALAVLVNTQYLAEHGLVKSGYRERKVLGLLPADQRFIVASEHTITAKGADFISEHGGLTAVLNTVTVRIDPVQWAELLARKVEEAPGISHAERSQIASALRKLPAQAIEKLSSKMLDWAVDHAADALPQLRMWLDQVVG